MIYDVTAIHCKSVDDLNAMVDSAVKTGAMTRAIQHAGRCPPWSTPFNYTPLLALRIYFLKYTK